MTNRKIITIRKGELEVKIINRQAMIIFNPPGKEGYCIKSFMSDSPALVAELKRDISTEIGLRDLAEYLNKGQQDDEPLYRIVD